ncbi:MAG TPA: hypothetical protein VGM34_00085 [Chlamydiales bacterium]
MSVPATTGVTAKVTGFFAPITNAYQGSIVQQAVNGVFKFLGNFFKLLGKHPVITGIVAVGAAAALAYRYVPAFKAAVDSTFGCSPATKPSAAAAKPAANVGSTPPAADVPPSEVDEKKK